MSKIIYGSLIEGVEEMCLAKYDTYIRSIDLLSNEELCSIPLEIMILNKEECV